MGGGAHGPGGWPGLPAGVMNSGVASWAQGPTVAHAAELLRSAVRGQLAAAVFRCCLLLALSSSLGASAHGSPLCPGDPRQSALIAPAVLAPAVLTSFDPKHTACAQALAWHGPRHARLQRTRVPKEGLSSTTPGRCCRAAWPIAGGPLATTPELVPTQAICSTHKCGGRDDEGGADRPGAAQEDKPAPLFNIFRPAKDRKVRGVVCCGLIPARSWGGGFGAYRGRAWAGV